VAAARAKLPNKDDEAPHSGIRHRKGGKAKAAKEAAEAQAAASQPVVLSHEQLFGPPVGSLPLRAVIERKPLPDMRLAAANHIQFELLLSTTKYVIPLAALVATGQAFNGLWSSMITAQLLSRLPTLRPEWQHVLILLVGAAHTLLCAGKAQLNEAPAGVLQLQWTWSPHDVLAVVNIMVLGAIAASVSHSGNEPPFCASFAAGLTLRIVSAELLPSHVTSALMHLLRRFDLEVVGVDEIAVRASGPVGSCGGGLLRAALGPAELSAPALRAASLCVKAVLLLLPTLAMAQWWLRSAVLVQRLRKEGGRQRPRPLRSGELLVPVLRRRLLASGLMAGSLTLTVVFFGAYELNGINASLGNFLVAALVGCLFESLLATYEMQGRLRQFVFFIMFMLL